MRSDVYGLVAKTRYTLFLRSRCAFECDDCSRPRLSENSARLVAGDRSLSRKRS
jgi:hypothetical protein